MRCTAKILVVTLLCLLAPASLGALETDQFMAWHQELEDSTDHLNSYLNRQIEIALERANQRSTAARCEELPVRIYRRLFRHILFPRVRRFLATDPHVDRFPGREVGYFGFLKKSIFRKPAFPFLLPMARTIRVNEVNLGVDKIGHMLGFGRRYYVRYRRARRRGFSDEEATRRVVHWGYTRERLAVGGLVDGVVSHADLEANYQGLLLARDFCEASPPHLVETAAGWRLQRPVDLRAYVSPNFDETYNPSRITRARWRKVRPIVEAEYCGQYRAPRVQKMMRRYRARDRPSFAMAVTEERSTPAWRERRRQQALDVVCAVRPSDQDGTRDSASGK